MRSQAVVLKDESSDLVLSIGCSHQLSFAGSAPMAKVHLLQGAGEWPGWENGDGERPAVTSNPGLRDHLHFS